MDGEDTTSDWGETMFDRKSGCRAELVYYVPAPVARAMLALEQEDYTRAVEEARRLGQHFVAAYRPTALLTEAQALRALGARIAAYARLVEARSEAEAIGSRCILWRILHLLGELAPDREQAERARRQARKIVLDIANHIDSSDLRGTFLDTPQVRSLLDEFPYYP